MSERTGAPHCMLQRFKLRSSWTKTWLSKVWTYVATAPLLVGSILSFGCSDHVKSMFQHDQIISNPIWIYIYILYIYILFKSHNLMLLLQFSIFPLFHFYLIPPFWHHSDRQPTPFSSLCRPRPARVETHRSSQVRSRFNAPLLQEVATVPGQVVQVCESSVNAILNPMGRCEPWCWYIYLQNWVIFVGQMFFKNIPYINTWSIWVWINAILNDWSGCRMSILFDFLWWKGLGQVAKRYFAEHFSHI